MSRRRHAVGPNGTTAVHSHLTDLESLGEIRCPKCGDYLTLHQPDQNLPHRMLGTCDCRAWYGIDTDQGVMIPLPLSEA